LRISHAGGSKESITNKDLGSPIAVIIIGGGRRSGKALPRAGQAEENNRRAGPEISA